MTTNFLLFNPAGTGQQSDADYNSDGQRSGGLVPGIANPAMHNKAFYQWSAMIFALAKLLSDAGETVSDTNPAALQTSMEKILKKASGVNVITGTTYTVLTTDRNLLIESANSSAVAITLPNAGSTGFDRNFRVSFQNNGSGLMTISTSAIDGGSSIVLGQGQGVDVYSDNTAYFTQRGAGILAQYFESTAQTITSAGTLTIAHGLGRKPKFIEAFIVNLTAEQGFSVGDETPVNIATQAGTDRGLTITYDTTNIYVTYGAQPSFVFIINNKTNGQNAGATNTKWNLVLRAFA